MLFSSMAGRKVLISFLLLSVAVALSFYVNPPPESASVRLIAAGSSLPEESLISSLPDDL